MANVVLHPASLRPPTNRGGVVPANAATRPSWALLDFSAFVLDLRNASTATCTFTRHREIQLHVTFVVGAHPPDVSYFCVYCHGLAPGAYSKEPQVIATEADLVLIRVVIGGRSARASHSAQEFFVYKAGGPQGQPPPSLEQIPRLRGRFLGIGGGGYPVGLLKLHDDTGYIVAALCDDDESHFEVCLFDSKDKVWTTRPVAVPRGDDDDSCHETTTVITIGGERGTMAFVDLWRGILLYDVLADNDDNPVPRYIPLPETIFVGPHYSVNPLIYRDIAVVNGQFKYIEMGFQVTADKASRGRMVAAYSMPIASCHQEDASWHRDCKIDVSKIRDDKNVLSPELQRMLSYDERMTKPEPTLGTLCTGHPTFSLHDEDTVYFMTMAKPVSSKACVVAVNMKEGTIQAVARIGARTRGINFTYIRSRISSYLKHASRR